MCSCKNKYTTQNESCEMASITGGKVNDRLHKNIVSKSAIDSTRSAIRSTVVSDSVNNSTSVDSNKSAVYTGQALYNHQQEDFDRFKDEHTIALFEDMGLGKSATSLTIIAHQFKQGLINALLVIAPNDIHRQWAVEQIPLWLDAPYDIQLFGGRGGAKKTYPFEDDPDLLQIVCVNVDIFSTRDKWRDIVDWANYNNTAIILDEATVIKNVTTKRTERILYSFNDVRQVRKTIISSVPKSVTRIVLTGTPVTNSPMDLWPVMEFLKPNYFGRNYYSFKNHYGMFTRMAVNNREIAIPLTEEWWKAIKACMTYDEAYAICGVTQDTYNYIHSQTEYQGPYKNAEELRELIKPVSVCRVLTDCVDMPDQIYNTKRIIMSDEQRECYDDMVKEYIATYNEHNMTALNKISVLIRLQQISSGFLFDAAFEPTERVIDTVDKLYGITDDFDITPDDRIQWIGKSNPKLDMLYNDVDEAAKPTIIITRFSAEAARIYADLSVQHDCCLITGWKRVGTIEEFKNGKYEVMVANSAVVSRGLNLQNSHNMQFYSNTFSLETRLQAEGRIFRLGQKEPCMYTDYINDDSVDEKIISTLKLKRNLLDFIRGADIKELLQ
jgi:SNF2 family DNA or RNA helicase